MPWAMPLAGSFWEVVPVQRLQKHREAPSQARFASQSLCHGNRETLAEPCSWHCEKYHLFSRYWKLHSMTQSGFLILVIGWTINAEQIQGIEGGWDLGGVGGQESMIRIHCMGNLFSNVYVPKLQMTLRRRGSERRRSHSARCLILRKIRGQGEGGAEL